LQSAFPELRDARPTAGHPVVFAQRADAGPDAPTILVYGHYDVQPPEPLELWESPPFGRLVAGDEPHPNWVRDPVRDGRIVARGSTDDKGQVHCHLKGLETHLKAVGPLPVNVKLLIEGEEEIGSPSLAPWIDEHRARLDCDAVIISDTAMYAPGVPAITNGLKGLVYFQVDLEGPSHDLHSGAFGGAVPNPVNVLTQMMAKMIDPATGRIAVPGFYDEVRDITDAERAEWAGLSFDDAAFQASAGADALIGETGYSVLEQLWARPTFDLNGIWGGFQGHGAKTVLPAEAHAKFSCRLVPDQDPTAIEDRIEAYLQQICPPTVRMTITRLHSGKPVLTERDHPAVLAGIRALKSGFGADPVFIRTGGSIPIVATFAEKLGAPTVLLGFGLEDDRAHSPNEKFDLACYTGGIKTSAHLWSELAGICG
jgi:acetylornithine deacetylase/succinyl-diaminopimelate desuccinylase-like protein